MTKSIFGICHICGQEKKLSFEHVPPRAAFNDRPVLRTAFEDFLCSENPDEIKGEIQQRGAGAHTLCEKCNSDTGSWYGGPYAKWASQAMQLIIETRGKPSLGYSFNLFPLRVLKQIICMFFSANSPQYQALNTDLVRFVLNRESFSLRWRNGRLTRTWQRQFKHRRHCRNHLSTLRLRDDLGRFQSARQEFL
jgi:hypothetical protein